MATDSIAGASEGRRRLAPGYLRLARWSWWIWGFATACVGVATMAILETQDLLGPLSGWPSATAIAVWGAAFVAASLVVPRLQYGARSYAVSDDGLELWSGVLWRRYIKVKRSRIQYTDVEQGPLMRCLDLARLVIYTAGSAYASIALDGIDIADATALRDRLLE